MLTTVRQFLYFHRFMPIGDALRLLTQKDRRGVFSIQPYQLDHPIKLRGATTDVNCFQKVFLDLEYRCPFGIQPKVIVDAGANTGLSAIYFAERYRTAKVVAIEPEPNNFDILKANCTNVDRIIPVHGALWPISKEIALTDTFDGREWAYTVGRHDLKRIGTVNGVTVLDALRIAQSDHIDILKLNIEGSEKELFSGDVTWLDRVSIIVIELHDRIEPGCSRTVYQKLTQRQFHQEVRGESIFIQLNG